MRAALAHLLVLVGAGLSAATNRCGTSFSDAESRCGTLCPGGYDGQCPSGQHCYAAVTCTAPAPAPSGSANRCGTSFTDTQSRCGTLCPGGYDGQCPSGQHCYAAVSCSGGSPGPAPTSSGSANRCGTSFTDAVSRCGTLCPGGYDGQCPSGQHCYAAVSCSGGSPGPAPTSSGSANRCGTSFTDAVSRCGTLCPGGYDGQCPSGQHCYAAVSCSGGGGPVPVPAPVAPVPVAPVSASVHGYYHQTYTSETPLSGSNLAIAFGGWADVTTALSDAAGTYSKMVGTKYLDIGGGNSNGYWTSSVITKLNANMGAIVSAGWRGVCYDIEVGDSGLASAFANSFAQAKAKGLQVLVTVSHSGPYGFSDPTSVMNAVFASSYVDYVSPQLYTSGYETSNDYTAGVVPFSAWKASKPRIVVSIASAGLYSSAQSYFQSTFGIALSGFVAWN